MLMMMVAVALGVSIWAVAKAVLGGLLSLIFYRISELYLFCCRKREGFQLAAARQRFGFKRRYF